MSISKITFLHEIIPNDIFILNNPYVNRLYFNDTIEINQFLNELKNDTVYVVTLEFVYSWLLYEEDGPIINLTKPILITKNSNPRVISNFIKNRIK
jgi:hypothetical protein